MVLKLKYATANDIPKGFAALYEERDGEFVLVGVEGMKTQSDIDNLVSSHKKRTKEAVDKAIKDALNGRTTEDIDKAFEELEELRSRVDAEGEGSGSKKFETAVESAVEKRIKRITGPMERELTTLKSKLEGTEKERDAAVGSLRRRNIDEAVRDAATSAGVMPEAVGDVVALGRELFDTETDDDGTVRVMSRDGKGGDPVSWVREMKTKRPYFWPASQGGGAGGGGKGNIKGQSLDKLSPRELLERGLQS